MPISTNRFLTYAALITVVVFWGLSFVATKIALETLPAFTLIFIRFSAASLFFLLIMLGRGFPKLSRGDHARVFLMALFEPGLYFIFETIGLQHTSAPKAALIIATIPVAVLVLAFLFLGERPHLASILGIALSLAGIGILVAGDPRFSYRSPGSFMGDLMIIGAVITAALYMVCARHLGRSHGALETTGFQMMYGALLYAPVFLLELPTVPWPSISGRSVVALAYLTVFATCAAFLFYNFALTQLPAGKASVFINGIPVVTAVAAWILLGETLTPIQFCGGILVLTAVCLANLPRRDPGRRPVPKAAPLQPGQIP